MAVMYDYVLDELRLKDVVLVSLASGSVLPDPLIVNNLQVKATASINNLYLNNAYISTATIGNLTTNNLAVTSLASINHINANSILASTATLGLTHISTIDWNLTSGVTLTVEGQMNWSAIQQTAVIGMAGGNVDLALGMETLFPRRVVNSTATTMPKGSVVYINGVSGNDPTVDFAIATGDMTSAFTLGMTAEDITAGQKGWVATFGELTGIDLSSFTGGDTLYLSGATAGLFTNTPQLAPYHYVRVGTVVKATADGSLVVNVINGYELDELHNVAISSLASGQIIQSGASSLWYNRSLASAVADLNVLASLGSLAYQNTVDYVTQVTSKPSLGSLAVLNDLSYTSLLNLPSLGSLAEQNTVDYLTQITNLPSLGSLAVLNELSYGSLLSAPSLNGEYLRLDLTNTPLTGQTLSFNDSNNKVISVSRASNSIGRSLTIQAGGAKAGLTNANGGNINLITGVSTGLGGSDLIINTVTPGTSGTTDRNPTQKMVVKGNGNVGINQINPSYKLDVGGDARFQSIYTTNLNSAWYGNGSDGAKTFDGITEFPRFATLDTITSTYTLTRDVYFTEMTVGIGVTVITAGFRIFCTISLINSGIIHNNGYDASGATGGVGGLGGASAFFKNGTNGSAGRTGTTVGNGIAPATVTNLVGGVGGRGAAGYLSLITYEGDDISAVNAGVPSLKVGGSEVVANIASFQVSYLASATNANIELTPSTGGGGGAKSAAGTAAGSGGGGGGGGFLYIAARYINNLNIISANGGNGGDAYGTNANVGGGGGGGGGVVGIVTHPSANSTLGTITANGGLGGASVAGTNSTRAVALANNTVVTTTANTITIIPALHLSKRSLYMVTIVALGTNPSVDNIIADNFYTEPVDWVYYNTIATPTRVLECWYMRWNGSANEAPKIDYQMIEIQLGGTITSARVNIDEIQNVDITIPIAGYAQNSSDSTNNLTVDLGYTPTTGNMVYSVFSRVAGTTPVVGTGNTAVSNLNTLPYLYTEVSTNRQTNNHSWTGATPAAGISIDLQQPPDMEDGADGWKGKVIIFND